MNEMTETKINKWFSAIKRSDIRYLRRNISKEMLLLENWEDLNSLSYAIRYNKYNVVKFILDNNIDGAIDINGNVYDHETYLEFCIYFHRYKITKLIIEKGAKISGNTLCECAFYSRADILEYLLGYNTDVNYINRHRNTPLILACDADDCFTCGIPEYEDRGVQCKGDRRDHKRYLKMNRQFIINMCRNELRCIELLLDHDPDLTMTNSLNETALYKALTDNNHNVVKILLAHGAKLLNGLNEPFDGTMFDYEDMNRINIDNLTARGYILNKSMCFNYNRISKETHKLIKDLDDYNEFVRINKNSHYGDDFMISTR